MLSHLPWRRSTRRLITSLAAALLLVAPACGDDDGGSADDDAATDETASDDGTGAGGVLGPVDEATGEPVRIGFISDGQNESTDQSIDFDVADATVEWLNTHRGGIAGRPIELVTCEAKLDPAVGTDCANQMVEEGVPAVIVSTTGVVENVWEPIHGAGIPTMWFAAQGDTVLSDSESTFTVTDPTAGVVGVPIGVATANGEDKVTAVVIDVPAALDTFEGAGAAAFEDAGVELELVKIPPGTPDMTPQLNPIAAGDPGVIHVLGNDAFCIAAFQALEAAAFDGPVTAITQCITDATRDAVSGETLEGITVGAASPVDADDESDELYRTVMETFGDGIDTSRSTGHGTFTAVAGFGAAVDGISGDITPESVIAAISSMPETELPDSAGLTFQCNGEQKPDQPAVCVDGSLVTTLDPEGNPTTYEPIQG
jgi:branched-chain amino acid transport system substrate-binding protein